MRCRIDNAGRLLVSPALILMFLSGCSRPSRPVQQGPITSNTIVASVDGEYVTLGEVLNQLSNSAMPGSNTDRSPENALQEVVYRKLAFLKADEDGDYDQKEIHRLAINRTHDVLMQYMFQDLVSKYVEIPDSSVDSAYHANIQQYTVPERRRVTHLLMSANPKAWEAAGIDVTGLSSEQLDAKAKERIDQLYREVKEGADLGELAAKYSHDTASKPKKGDSGLFDRGQMVDEFDRAAFKLPKGGLSAPFKSIYGWHILKVEEIQDSTVRPLDANFRSELYAQLRSAAETRLGSRFVDSVATKASFEWNEPLLEKNWGDYDPADWVCIVNGTDTIEAGMLKELELMYRTRNRTSEVPAETRKAILTGQSMPFVMSSVAKQLGYTDRDTIKAVYRNAYRQEIVNRIYRDRTLVTTEPSEKVLKRYYDDHIDEFKSAKPLKVQHIVFQDSLQAEQVKSELEKGADFRQMAMKYYPGEPDFKEAAFDLGWISREEINPQFYDAAWITDVGKYAGPVKTQWGYHLIKVVDQKQIKDFDAAQIDIKRILRDEAIKKTKEEWEKNLTRGHDIVKYDDILGQVDFWSPQHYFQLADSLKRLTADTVSSGS